jgi:membrane protein YdbS with pleckstrin-like domain
VTPLRRRRTADPLAGSLDPVYPQPAPPQKLPPARPVGAAPGTPAPRPGVKAPSVMQRLGSSLNDFRRRVLPLPDEIVQDFLATGEDLIHSDHPSFRSFVVENTLLFLGVLVAAVSFLGITFNGSFLASALVLIALGLVLLVLVVKRLEDRYTSYVVTDARIMQLKGIVSRRAHSIPWVRVTDLTIEQTFWGRVFGYATLHIESANEDSGLRDLEGVSDPVQFSKYVVDMVVAKQGTTQPVWVTTGAAPPPRTERGLRRVRLSSRRRREAQMAGGETPPATPRTAPRAPERSPGEPPRLPGTITVRRQPGTRPPEADRPYVEEEADLDPERLAAELQAADDHDLPWRDRG